MLDANWTEGIVLRYGAFYGPNTSLRQAATVRDGPAAQVPAGRQRRRGVVVLHIADAADATVAAVDHGEAWRLQRRRRRPRAGGEWLPALAQILGAKRPMHVPRFVGRIFTGELGVAS